MYKGKIVEQGTALEIFSNPKHPYTKGLLACRPPLNKRLKLLPTVSDFMKVDEHGNITESHKSVKEAIDQLSFTKEEREAQHKEIYSKEPILQIKNLKTYFPI